MSRWIIIFSVLVALIAGVVKVCQTFITPKHLIIKGYACKRPVSHKNEVEAFLVNQDRYQAYLKKTDHQWFSGTIIDIHDGQIDSEEGRSSVAVTRLFFKIHASSEILSGYLFKHHFGYKNWKVHDQVKVQLGSEFCELSNYTPKVDYSSHVLHIERITL